MLTALRESERHCAAPWTSGRGEPAEVAFLFSDVVGFTRMTERLGDFAAHRVMAGHRAVIAETARRNRGQTVEVRGDGFLLAFEATQNAMRCAVALQRELARAASRRPADAIRVRMGLHSGPAIAEGEGYFGRNVILAARIAGRAGPDEILVSARVRELARRSPEFALGEGRRVSLKGFAARQQVFALDWARQPALVAVGGR
jgi:class 3 adenylate cyclase